MSQLSNEEMEIMGYEKTYEYTNFSHLNHVNVIPEKDFKKLVSDTFKTISTVLRETYGPYGSTIMLSEQNQTTTTKDGYNVYSAMGFSHHYKAIVYHAIQKIIERVNHNVGDGTTSCILLAEVIFDILNEKQDTETKRKILEAISEIEEKLEQQDHLQYDQEQGIIKPLQKNVMESIIKMASNNDARLCNALMEAFDPEIEDGIVKKIRHVVYDMNIDLSYESNVEYKTNYLPGDYRIRVSLDDDSIVALSSKTQLKIALYDHAFSTTDWLKLCQNHDKDSLVLVIARAYTREFQDNQYKNYIRQRALVMCPPAIRLATIKGFHIQNEIKDLAAVLHTTPINEEPIPLNHDELPFVTIQIHNKSALCFFDCEPVQESYLNMIQYNMDHDESKSAVSHKDYEDRLKALKMDTEDTIIAVTTGSTLEAKMLGDKIDDCVSIVNSALKFGVVPNMLRYGYYRIEEIFKDAKTDIDKLICNSIETAITALFHTIWESKYGEHNMDKHDAYLEEQRKIYNEDRWCSYDIIAETLVPYETLATSAQYDIEVIVAALSIVKYLLTSRALIFGTNLLRMQGDEGKYVMSN